ncbi:hypothetical protein LWI29_000886 [Acer saccharum]|uniref:Retrotransposon gag domain-containing protein n=1 Tax=Acer saccharum TaxID=4024 RepID=A0AA39VKT5_ACESA|nr:hypothetical protein LWI29_000886 [Acer saccharum]
MHPRTRSQNLHFLNFDPEIERIARRNRREARRRAEMGDQNAQLGHMGVPNVANQNQGELPSQANPVQEGLPHIGDERTLRDYTMPRVELHQSSIRQPTIAANSFEIRPSIIQMIGTTCIFNGLVNDDPNLHLQKFNEICETFKYNGIPDDFIKLKLFPFSLGNDARIWLNSQSPNSITTYDQLAQAFLNRYFPPGKAARLRNEILSFQQFENESIYEAWERFKELQRRCPHNGLAKWQTLQAFYQGLTVSTRNLVDAAAGGSLMSKSMDAANELLEEMALNNSQWGSQRQVPKKIPGVLEVDERTSLQAQLASQHHQIVALQNKFSKMSAEPSKVQVAQCEWCLGPHLSMDCQVGNPFASSSQEQVSFVNYNRNFQNQPQQHHATQNPQNNPYQNTYNPPWRNNQNLSWKDNQPQQQQNLNQRQPPGFPQPHQQNCPNQVPNDQVEKKSNLEEMFSKYMGKLDNILETQDLALRKLDTKIDQVAQHSQASIQNLETQVGQLARAIQGRQQGALPSNTVVNPKEQCNAISLRSGKEVELSENFGMRKEDVVEEKKSSSHDNVPTTSQDPPPPPEVKAYVPPIPYPQRLKKHKDAHNFGKFLEIFKKLQINIPFAEALSQMPTYVRFLKELLSNKRKLEEFETVALTEECSAILQNKLPPKLKDPGKFTIPCTIGHVKFESALIDSGASINLMPYSVFKKLGMGEVKPTRVTLQLADRSIKHPYGVLEDVLMKVGKFYFPVDFVILDMEEDFEVPLILGRPFLKTSGALVDHKEDKLTLRVGEEHVVFDFKKVANRPMEVDRCLLVEVVDPPIGEFSRKANPKEPPNSCVVQDVPRMKMKGVRKPGSYGVKKKTQVTPPDKIEKTLDKRDNKKKSCMVDQTRIVNGFCVRMFYASHKLRKKGGEDVAPTIDPD